MPDTGDSSQHKRSRSSAALSLLRRKDKDVRHDDNSPSEDVVSHATLGLTSRPTTAQSPTSIPVHQQSVKGHNSRMSLGRVSSQPAANPQAVSRASLNIGDRGATTIEQSVRKFRIVEALRSGNTAAISKAIRETSENPTRISTSSINATNIAPLEDTTVLHLAIQCAEFDVVEYVMSDGAGYIDVNARDKDGNVPLHIAAAQGRGPIVRLLLEQKDINDAIANNQGKLPLDVARNPDIFQQLQLSRTLFVQDKVKHVQDLVRRQDYDTLGQVLEEPRVKTILDINSNELPSDIITVQAGGTLLHEAARRKDTKLIQALLLHGADPFQRDRRGKLPQDVTKDDLTRAMLKKSPAAVAAQRGIQEKAVLGHAASQGGAVPTAADPLGGREQTMKGYLKKWTNYRKGYQLRWFVLENGVLSYYKHQDDAENACRGAISMRIAKLNMSPDEKTKFEIIGKSSVKYTLKANHEVEAKRWFWALNNAIQWMKDQAKEEQKQKAQTAEYLRQAKDQLTSKSAEASINDPSEAASVGEARSSVQLSRFPSTKLSTSRTGLSHASTTGSIDDEFAETGGADDLSRAHSNGAPTVPGDDNDDDDEDDDEESSGGERPTATKDAFNITAQSAKLQLDTLAQVSAALQAEANRNPGMSMADPKAAQALATYDAAIKSLKGLMGDLLRISKDRDAHWQYRLDQEIEMRQMWEESMAKVAKEQEILEARIGEAEHKRKITKRALREVMESSHDGGRPGSSYSAAPAVPAVPAESTGVTEEEVTEGRKSPSTKSILRRPTALSQVVDISEDSESEQEEFFDAVDAGEVDVEELPPSESANLGNAEQAVVVSGGLDVSSTYKGYENGVRTRLKLDSDNRPKVGLWGILKSMIGKDMTKMTLPVSFNEPTSLLYRTGEDMEYADLLDLAADRSDSIERLLYVAAFAASEFASTIGRVAKPFNPLLGETFEYARPDKGYRFFIEQVSHHPPIGAAFAESAKWTYYGEANVKSKFLGRTFDIQHLGTWFLELRPTNGGKPDFYTWKKPTSCVVGIITGNPAVDNYGPMEIKNWTTGEECKLEFKPRGWKASSAYHLNGKIMDSDGRPRFSLGGRWNSKLYARYTPGYEATVEEPTDGGSILRGSISDSQKAFLLWQAHERPEGIPFNLTPFVLTFNHLDENLRQWIAPTDSRYRPDQRAMEDGEYDTAAAEKDRLENDQRKRRRVREEHGEHFTPAWFEKAKCPTTGEEYWKFTGKYWEQREKYGSGDQHAWDGLEPLFVPQQDS
ncbi:Oxysterol-binding protein-domain-containing protein [Pseudomassariella vexata]|uniref:Oxysterol-binding protein-domain-containing protein n=1 Tax=Pseudomassariella vexata TaxID=1141098 RepID=A0A1Y2DN61_9PEZI|nr:Oxysterol-binding protein-domain-containing protein [Pseudomassariella vexata]ORY60594.1 Oxysterol-binding protein-domain-containing protein [Pseudomassariella vexata]